jgi:hypothetical protein
VPANTPNPQTTDGDKPKAVEPKLESVIHSWLVPLLIEEFLRERAQAAIAHNDTNGQYKLEFADAADAA